MRVLATAAAGVLLVAGCGDDSQGSSPTTVEVVGVDYGYEGLPDEIVAGSDIVFRNRSETEVHEFVAVRLDDDDQRPVEELLALAPDELGPMLRGASSVIIAPPAIDATPSEGMVVEGSATLDQPDRYAIICLIPTGADPDAYLAAAAEAEGGPPDVPGGPPHAIEGMVAELTVVPASG